ncbi:MAG: helix-turn-helix transcriptional regulator [Acidimicrobiales bacterium]
MPEDEFMTAVEFCKLIKAPLATVYQWNHRGTGPKALKIGRHLRFRRSDVDAWLAGCEIKASEAAGG